MCRTRLCFGPLQPGLFGFVQALEFTVLSSCVQSSTSLDRCRHCHRLTSSNYLLNYVSPSILPRLTHFTQATTSTLAEVMPTLCFVSNRPLPGTEWKLSWSTFFKCSTGQPLSPGFLSQWLTDTFVAARADGTIASQSFKTGAAFVDVRAGSPYYLTQAIGRDGQEVPASFKTGSQQELWQN